MSQNEKDQLVVNVVKGLVMDAVRKANSGHTGGAMSSADFAYVLFKDYLNFDPDDTHWFNRDRFVLSAGHESMLLYAFLYLQGRLEMEDLENFRQWGSRTPGHPECDLTPGVEATSGPLGQGLSMAVGMATAEAHLRAVLGEDACGHYTYCLASDGDFQEPISFGTASLAGLWGLDRLIVFYDSNQIQIGGTTHRADCTDWKKVYEGINWQVIEVDGNDRDAIRKAMDEGRANTEQPTLIIGHTTMAKGAATMEGSHNTHGSPMPPEEIAATKKKIGLDPEQFFQVPQEAIDHFREGYAAQRERVNAWYKLIEEKKASDAEFAKNWSWVRLPAEELDVEAPQFDDDAIIATRKAWGMCLDHITDSIQTLIGGSADLDPSNQTANFAKHVGDFQKDNPLGRNLAFGVREFPMGAICNGIALHGGLIPFGATFLTFSDYERNALRMAALQKLSVVHIFTHDSFYLGEDGPTHQSIEHASSLRLIPNLRVFRPADPYETAASVKMALKQPESPSCLLLTRQGVPALPASRFPATAEGPYKGGYVLQDCDGTPDVVLIATGSEVGLSLEAAKQVKGNVRIVSMPCMEIFEEQTEEYKDSVIPRGIKVYAAAEAGTPELWHKYVGRDGVILGIDHFGHSAPNKVLAEKYGFTPDNLAALINAKLEEV